MTNNMTEDQALELLPWYINGTLTAEEFSSVKAAVDSSELLQKEVAALEQLRDTVVALEEEDTIVAPSELGWMRLKKQIASHENANSVVAKPAMWRGFIATAAVLVVALQVTLVVQPKGDEKDIQLLSGYSHTEHPLQQLENFNVLQIRFTDKATIAEVNEILQQVQAVVISGPTAVGLYQIVVPNTVDIEATLSLLEGQVAVSHVAEETAE